MPRKEVVISAFVASPNDVAEERNALEDIITEYDITWSKQLGLRLELLRWETHALPGIGSEPQAVINRQIPDEYDIFIGMLWTKFGTPTETAGSGTEEEFNRAHRRYLENPDSVNVMFYFKEGLIPTNVDTAQLALVQKFKASLGEKGVLYWTFKDKSEFEQLLRIHLSKQAQDWKQKLGSELPGPQFRSTEKGGRIINPAAAALQSEVEESEGLIDLVEMIGDDSETIVKIMERMTKAVTELTAGTQKRTQELNRINGLPSSPQQLKKAKTIINRMASDMEQFALRMEAEITAFADTYSRLINESTKAFAIRAEFPDAEKEMRPSLEALKKTMDQMVVSNRNASSFKMTISSLPRMSTNLNRAKRKTEAVLDSLIGEVEKAIELTSAAVQSFG